MAQPARTARTTSLTEAGAVFTTVFTGSDAAAVEDYEFGTDAILGLGALEVGGQSWSNSSNYGIHNGQVFSQNTNPGIADILGPAGTKHIYFRKKDTSFVTGIAQQLNVVFNKVDATNYNSLFIDEYGFAYVMQTVAGVSTALGAAFTFEVGWLEARITFTGGAGGNEIKIYRNGAEKATRTLTQNLAGLRVGQLFNTTTTRCREFGVTSI